MSTKISPFGRLMRKRRKVLDLSLRDLSKQVGCSHVWLGEVERGRRRALAPQYWPDLAVALQVSEKELKEAAAMSQPVEIAVDELRPEVGQMVSTFARKVQRQDISEDALAKILELLGDDSE